jgi:hypothetical protein
MLVRNIRTQRLVSEKPMPAHTRVVLLFPDDVAQFWTEEQRKVEGPGAAEVRPDRVHDFLRWSKPTPPGARWKHRYEGHPMPYPRGTRGAKQPAWHEDQEADLRAFWHDRVPGARRDDALVAARQRDWAEDPLGILTRTR